MGEVVAHVLDGVFIDDIDAAQTLDGTRRVALDVAALQQRLNQLKAELVLKTADQLSGKKYIEKALRDAARDVAESGDEKVVLETILHPHNRSTFHLMAVRGILDFLAVQEKAGRQLEMRSSWQAPENRFLELTAPIEGYAKCLYKPVLEGQFQKSSVEAPFSWVLDGHPGVDAWLKNGDHGGDHFALKYELDGADALFFPDFIVRTTQGGYRLFDTKGSGPSDLSTGNTRDTHAKARALFGYVKALQAKGVDVDGGIVVCKRDQWWVHSGEDYPGTVEVSEAKGWRPFQL